MTRLRALLVALLALLAPGVQADGLFDGSGAIINGITPIFGCPNGTFVYNNAGVAGCSASGTTITFPQAVTGGNSGGVPYFSAAGTMSASSPLAANQLMIGGGAGAAPTTTTTGSGVLGALGQNVGAIGAFVVNGGTLGTPASANLANATNLPLTTGVTGILPQANGGTGTAAPALVAGPGISITGSWPNQTVASSTIILSVDATFYVDPAGNDANDCSLATPCQTPQHVADLMGYVDANGYKVTIQVNAGTYQPPIGNSYVMAVTERPKNCSKFEIVGDTTTPGNVIFDANDLNNNTSLSIGRADSKQTQLTVDVVKGFEFKNASTAFTLFGLSALNELSFIQFRDNFIDMNFVGHVYLWFTNSLRLLGNRSLIISADVYSFAFVFDLQANVGATLDTDAFSVSKSSNVQLASANFTNLTAIGGAVQWTVDAFCTLDRGGATIPGAAGTTDALGKVV